VWRRSRHFRAWLAWVTVFALGANVTWAGAMTACVAVDGGRVDLRPAVQSCGGCPVFSCPNGPAPVEPQPPVTPLDTDCCYDVPLGDDLLPCVMPRESETRDALLLLIAAQKAVVTLEPVRSLPRAVGPPDDGSEHHVHVVLACLHSVLLLL
jgi:hypothetical protein